MPIRSDHTLCKRWLVFRLGHLGDVTLTTGVLDRFARDFGWTFVFATKRPWADIFIGNPHVERVIVLDEPDMRTVAFAARCRRLASEYRGWGLLDLHGSLRSLMLSAFWRGPVLRYPKMSLDRRIFLRTRAKTNSERLLRASVPQRYFMAASPDFPPAEELLPRIWLSDEERAEARRRLDSLLGKGSAPVALHPFATHALKTWPEEHWRAFAALLEQKGIPWLALGRGKPLFVDQAHDLSNATTLRESCALLSHCRALVSGDSGPMHLASAVGTPVVALFGPTTREWGFYPAGPHDRVLERNLPCRPCSLHGLAACRRCGECLAGIPPEKALEALEQQAREAVVTRVCRGFLPGSAPDCAMPPLHPENRAPTSPQTAEERDRALFDQIMSGARDQATPLRDLHARADALAVPDKNPATDAPADDAVEHDWTGAVDSTGNPRWITLSVREPKSEDGRIVPESVLPPSLAPLPETPEQQGQPQRAGLLRTLLDRLKSRPRSPADRTLAHTRDIRPMRGFFRMLLVTAILGMLYYILAQRGWVPRLF